VYGDRGKLFRVLTNLIDNAIKFSDQGQILVSCHSDGREVEVSVSDQGQGILPENLDRVFERFFQEKSRFHGLGVGLAISKMIVEAHGGTIWAESAGRDRGASLHFRLPVMGSEEEGNGDL
jgi:signal transduction histidine kinase